MLRSRVHVEGTARSDLFRPFNMMADLYGGCHPYAAGAKGKRGAANAEGIRVADVFTI